MRRFSSNRSPFPAGAVAFIAILAFSVPLAPAVMEKGDWPWNLKLPGWHDRAIPEKLGTGWFLNVGPTGLRVHITHEHPQYLTVKFVFENSPAFGLVGEGDIVVGANGTMLTVPHTFGRQNIAGWEGPMLDMSKLIEDSQGKDGKLDLIIWPSGAEASQKTVTLQLEPIGRFSPTWPFECPRSDKLLTDLCDFLVAEHQRAGSFEKRTHTHSAAVLALMASGDPKYDSVVKSIMSGYGLKRWQRSPLPARGSQPQGRHLDVGGRLHPFASNRNQSHPAPASRIHSHSIGKRRAFRRGTGFHGRIKNT